MRNDLINFRAFEPYKDSRGNVWAPETGIEDGNTIERGDIPIANTDMAPIYRTEHYSMTRFTQAVPTGNGGFRLPAAVLSNSLLRFLRRWNFEMKALNPFWRAAKGQLFAPIGHRHSADGAIIGKVPSSATSRLVAMARLVLLYFSVDLHN